MQMNSAISIPAVIDRVYRPESGFDHLVAELDHYRQRSEILSRVNDLHSRLAVSVDLTEIVEAFSVWLMPFVEHKLLAYTNPAEQRRFTFCFLRGPEKEPLVKKAEKSLAGPFSHKELKRNGIRDGNYYVSSWELKRVNGYARLIIYREQKEFSAQDEELVRQGIDILADSIRRGLDYESLYVLARRDALTGLANRRVFEERIGSLLESSRRHDRPISIISMDLDRFKEINDNFGHAEGDKVLQQVAQVLSKHVRASDLLVRTGGDEFLLLLPDTDRHAAKSMAGRLCKAVDALRFTTQKGTRLGVSIGVVQWQSGLAVESWLRKADEALYRAKENGRHCICMG